MKKVERNLSPWLLYSIILSLTVLASNSFGKVFIFGALGAALVLVFTNG